MCIVLAINLNSSEFSVQCLPLEHSSVLFPLASLQIVSGANHSLCLQLFLPLSFLRRVGLLHLHSGCFFVLLCRESSQQPTGSQTCRSLQRAQQRDNE